MKANRLCFLLSLAMWLAGCGDEREGEPSQPGGGGTQPQQQARCHEGEIRCETSTVYRKCNAATGTWSKDLTACGRDVPICAVDHCSPAGVCLPTCVGDLIRRCSNDGMLLAASSCGTGMQCVVRGGAATCTGTTDPGIRTSVDTLTAYEGGSATFTVVLQSAPSSDVVITPTSNSPEASVVSGALTFSTLNWKNPQEVTVRANRDGLSDGNRTFDILLAVQSNDSGYAALAAPTVRGTAIDTESNKQAGTGKTSVRFRAVAANITSGKNQAYGEGHGVRILQAIQPDIVMIQEFNWDAVSDKDATAMRLVSEAFGDGFYVHRGRGTIPNGIISRYPIIESGYWESNKNNNRDWDWSIIDLPGAKELFVISVHLHTDFHYLEIPLLVQDIKAQIESDKARNLEYFVMIGGDFNKNFKGNGALAGAFKVKVTLPVDQNDDSTTNASRDTTLDHVFVDAAFQKFEVPVEIAGHSYPNGHVFDTRVYAAPEHNEISKVPPARADDSNATNMQHMAVIRDFSYTP